MERRMIAVIGPSTENCTDEIYAFGEELGKALVDNDYTIVSGGMFGIMEAVFKGARNSENYSYGCTVGIIPFEEHDKANKFCDIVIPSGLGYGRNLVVVRSGEVIIAVAGGVGTLSEIAYSWQFGKKVICYTGFEGWSKELAGEQMDNRRSDVLIDADSLEDIIINVNQILK